MIIENIIKYANNDRATIVFLNGDLGAGKTTNVKKIAKYFKIEDEIISPTYTLIQEYKITHDNHFTKLIHIDAYRLDKYDDLKRLRFEDYVNNKVNLIIIEWPERLIDVDFVSDLKINIKHDFENANAREVEIFAKDANILKYRYEF